MNSNGIGNDKSASVYRSAPHGIFSCRQQANALIERGRNPAKIIATVVDGDGNTLGDLDFICLRAVAAWEAEFVKAGLKIVPSPERQKEYARLSGLLQAIGMRYRAELPSGSTSLLMKLNEGNFVVEVYDRAGTKIGVVPHDQTSSGLRDALRQTFHGAVLPDHDGVIAII
jgi:hypothetical protein